MNCPVPGLLGVMLLLILSVPLYASHHADRYADFQLDPDFACAQECKLENPKEALIYMENGFESALAANDTLGCAFWKRHIGAVYVRLGYYDLALQFLSEAMLVFKNYGNKHSIQETSRDLGMAYHFAGEYEHALPYYQDFLAYKISQNPPGQRKNKAYAYVAHIYRLLGRFDQALEAYHLALTKKSYLGISGDIGKTYLAMQDYDQAKTWILKSLAIREEEKKYYAVSSSCIDLAQLYLETNDPDSCLYYVQKGVQIAKAQHTREHLKELYCIAAEASYQQKKLEAFHQYNGLCQLYTDSLLGIRTQAKIAEYNALFETIKKENEIQLLTQSNEIQQLKIDRQTWVLVVLIILGIIIVLFLLLIFQNYRNRKITREISLEQKLLRTQMNPHFIHNSLMAIQGFVYKDDPAATSKHLSGFAQLTRHILQYSTKDLISLSSEVHFLKQYLSLQQLRFNDSFSVEFTLSSNLNTDLWMVPPMLTQPFIENAIEHGIKPLAVNGLIAINFELLADELVITVEDNGIGINKTLGGMVKQANRKSMAINITKERLALINRKRKKPVRFTISDREDEGSSTTGTRVVFTIPAIPMGQFNNKMKVAG